MKYVLPIVLAVSLAQTNPMQGLVCLDIVKKLETNTKSGANILITTCCGGVKLYATLRVLRGRTTASNWRAEDQQGQNLPIEKPSQRTRTVSIAGRPKERITETVIVITSKGICFVIAQRREVA